MRNQVKGTVDHCKADAGDPAWYLSMVEGLGLRDPATRGTGSATTIAALALSWVHQDSPETSALRVASELHTDTDTIATMAGALAGAANADAPIPLEGREDFSDRDYVRLEAERIAGIAAGTSTPPALKYPDLLTWSLPHAQVDLIGESDGELWLAGMSRLRPTGAVPAQRGEFVWQWFVTDWNQHILAKVRSEPRPMPMELMPAGARFVAPDREERGERPSAESPIAVPVRSLVATAG